MADKRRKISNRQRLLDFALSLPGAWQDEPWAGDVVAKVGTKIFVFFGGDDGEAISVKLDESHAMASAVPGAKPTGYGLGKHGWVLVPITGPDAPELTVIEDWIEESYAARATKKLIAELIARNESGS
ncbi:MAG: MmcQ/YjbR family DNA-binding protein [Acidimicrobiia bacterium]